MKMASFSYLDFLYFYFTLSMFQISTYISNLKKDLFLGLGPFTHPNLDELL